MPTFRIGTREVLKNARLSSAETKKTLLQLSPKFSSLEKKNLIHADEVLGPLCEPRDINIFLLEILTLKVIGKFIIGHKFLREALGFHKIITRMHHKLAGLRFDPLFSENIHILRSSQRICCWVMHRAGLIWKGSKAHP